MKSNTEANLKVNTDGASMWYLNGQFHREDGPAVILPDGEKRWYLNGQLHREDGPAVMDTPNGDTSWYRYGNLHREDGPAIEYCEGKKSWYLNGEGIMWTEGPVTKEQLNEFFMLQL